MAEDVLENIQEDDRGDVFGQYPGLGFLEQAPEVSGLRVKKIENNVHIAFASSDGYSFDYVLRPPKDRDCNGSEKYLKYLKDQNGLIIDRMVVSRNKINFDFLDGVQKDNTSEEITLAIDTSKYLSTIPDQFLDKNDAVNYYARNAFIYASSNAFNGEDKEKTINIPLPINNFGLIVFSHEVGHVYNDGLFLNEEEQLAKEGGSIYTNNQESIEKFLDLTEDLKKKKERAAHNFGLVFFKKFRSKMGIGPEGNRKINEIVNLALSSYRANHNKSNLPYDDILQKVDEGYKQTSVVY